MKAYLAEDDTRLEIVTGMELEALVLCFIRDPNLKKTEDIAKILKEYLELWRHNHE